MFRTVVGLFLVMGLLFALGCSGSPTAPATDAEKYFAGVSPVLTGVVGDFKFTGNDGSLETGKLVADGQGNVQMVSDRASSVYNGWWFKISVEYVAPRFYSSAGLPVYYLGDTFTYKLHIDYKRGLPLNWYPILYAEVAAEQRYWPSLAPLPGNWREVWDPVNIPPHAQDFVLEDTYYIAPGAVAGNDCTVAKIDLQLLCGWFEFCLAHGVAGLWEP